MYGCISSEPQIEVHLRWHRLHRAAVVFKLMLLPALAVGFLFAGCGAEAEIGAFRGEAVAADGAAQFGMGTA
jgi:hypothetical protein